MPITDILHHNFSAIPFSLTNANMRWKSSLRDHKDLQGQSRDPIWPKICLSTLEEIQITPQIPVEALTLELIITIALMQPI